MSKVLPNWYFNFLARRTVVHFCMVNLGYEKSGRRSNLVLRLAHKFVFSFSCMVRSVLVVIYLPSVLVVCVGVFSSWFPFR